LTFYTPHDRNPKQSEEQNKPEDLYFYLTGKEERMKLKGAISAAWRPGCMAGRQQLFLPISKGCPSRESFMSFKKI
jgi:hypothetical protein